MTPAPVLIGLRRNRLVVAISNGVNQQTNGGVDPSIFSLQKRYYYRYKSAKKL